MSNLTASARMRATITAQTSSESRDALPEGTADLSVAIELLLPCSPTSIFQGEMNHSTWQDYH
jgi:hypothetical protein